MHFSVGEMPQKWAHKYQHTKDELRTGAASDFLKAVFILMFGSVVAQRNKMGLSLYLQFVTQHIFYHMPEHGNFTA